MAKVKIETTPTKREGKGTPAAGNFVFGRKNYMLMIAGIVLLIIGFILMSGPAGEDIFEFRRITLAPLVVLAGFVVELFAIFAKSEK